MQILRTYVPDSFQNYNHLIVCDAQREAAAVDPYDAEHLLQLAEQQNLSISAIWITHEHGDHIRHVNELKAATGARVYAPAGCVGKLAADIWLEDGDKLSVGDEQATFWFTPGHTPAHGIYFVDQQEPALICGDTLFNAGVGNTRSGNTDVLFESIERIRRDTPHHTRIYPGHDYLPNNLNFALSLQPELAPALALKAEADSQTPDTRTVTTFEQELSFNLFLRLDDADLEQALSERGHSTGSALERFKALRTLRDQW
ncbi:MBL fold metallo-hydrolase [Saccharospirillum mangrovi]|uniref:MBL fold metallo-hydrolase n=1 Tax=Saccharospirillum mangrovi TaxID=2161747 RepID=UPI000D344810|nr:MBL fold metallo-hydrolase [Saccharospirillum mangrovi]